MSRNTYNDYSAAYSEIMDAASRWPNHLTDTAKARIISALLTYGEACKDSMRGEIIECASGCGATIRRGENATCPNCGATV